MELRVLRYFLEVARERSVTRAAERLHLQSGNSANVTERLDRGLLDFAVIVHEVDLSKYNYLSMPATDRYGVLMRKDSPPCRQGGLSRWMICWMCR